MGRIHSIRQITILSLALLCSACGELSYKRGAGPEELATIQKGCRSNSQTPAEYEACMSGNGWVVKNFDEKDPVADIEVSTDNRNPTGTIVHKEIVAGSTNPTSSTDSAAAIKSEPAHIASPDDLFKISSWWKIGGNDAGLKQAMNECVASLGEAHKPNVATQQTTRAFLICMKKSGWTGLRSK